MESPLSLVDYNRQQAMDARFANTIPKNATSHFIIGMGGIGFWVAIQLAMMGHDKFVFMDGQKIEQSNLNRLPVPQTWLGMNKAVAARRIVRMLRPETLILCVKEQITEDTLDLINTIHSNHLTNTVLQIWDTTDDARIQVKINNFAKTDHRYRYRKIGYEGFEIGNYKSFDVWFDEANYRPGYRTSSANVITSSLAAGLGIFAEGLGMTDDFQINLEKFMCDSNTRIPRLHFERCLDYCYRKFLTLEQKDELVKLIKNPNVNPLRPQGV